MLIFLLFSKSTNIEDRVQIPILYSSHPIRLQIFFRVSDNNNNNNNNKKKNKNKNNNSNNNNNNDDDNNNNNNISKLINSISHILINLPFRLIESNLQWQFIPCC